MGTVSPLKNRPTRRVIGPITARKQSEPLSIQIAAADDAVILVLEYAGQRITTRLTPNDALGLAATLTDAAYRADPMPEDYSPAEDLLIESIERTSTP